MAIDPYKITDFERGTPELEEFALFAAAVAGKKATSVAAKVDAFLTGCGYSGSPFDQIREMIRRRTLDRHMRRVRLGKYALLGSCYRRLIEMADAGMDLRTVSPEELETVPGIASKTARFLILHSRRDAWIAVIDTHVLKYLSAQGYKVPKSIPTGRRYAELEQIMLREAERAGRPMAEFDLAIWTWYADGNRGLPPFAPPRPRSNRAHSARARASNPARKGTKAARMRPG